MYTRIPMSPRLGDPPVAPAPASTAGSKLLRHFECSAAQLEQVTNIVGRPLGAGELRTLIEQAVSGVLKLARDGAVPVVGMRAALFEAVFGVRPAWHPAGAAWTLGAS
jgi:hypothetical protein